MKKNISILALSTAIIFYFSAAAIALLVNQSIDGQRVVYDDVNNLYWYPGISDFMYFPRSEVQTQVNELNTLSYAGFSTWQVASYEQVDDLALSFNDGNDIRSGFALPWEPFSLYFTPVLITDDCWVWGPGIPDCRSDDYVSASIYFGWISDAPFLTIPYTQFLFNVDGFSELVDPDIPISVPGAWVVATPSSIPEPATLILIGTGLAGIAAFKKKFKK